MKILKVEDSDKIQDYTPITNNPVPELNIDQLNRFSKESIHANPVASFDPRAVIATLIAKEGQKVIGADFGGDKGLTQLFIVKDGALQPDDGYTDYVQGTYGDGYLASLEKTAAYASANNIPVGISWGGPIDDTKPLYHPKVDHFLKELEAKYDGDIANIFVELASCLNDGPAGLVSGIVQASKQQSTRSVIFPINGGGIGMAVLVDNTLYATEAGHVELSEDINKYHQTTACDVFGAQYVCLERCGANKAGIEAQWESAKGSYMRARDIENQYKAGDTFAGELYDNSAMVVAHAIQGTAQAFNINLADPQTAVVGHGGAFKFPYYGKRITQILEQHTGAPVRLLMTKDYGDSASNACLDGAALAALLN